MPGKNGAFHFHWPPKHAHCNTSGKCNKLRDPDGGSVVYDDSGPNGEVATLTCGPNYVASTIFSR